MNSDRSIYLELFEKPETVSLIQRKLPELFLLAEVENSRNQKLGMEIGSTRERIIIALLMQVYGKTAVDVALPITLSEVDVMVHDEPLSIKTMSGKKLSTVKLIWSVDAQKAEYFKTSYLPACDVLLVHINWEGEGALYLFPKQTQLDVLQKLGRDVYIKLPKQGTNARGVELSREALQTLASEPTTCKIPITFSRKSVDYTVAYNRWLDLWSN